MSQENVEIVRGSGTLSLPSQRGNKRRLMEQRCFARFPTLFRLFTEPRMRLPPRSRDRRMLPTCLMQRAIAATNRRDLDLPVTGLDPEINTAPPEQNGVR